MAGTNWIFMQAGTCMPGLYPSQVAFLASLAITFFCSFFPLLSFFLLHHPPSQANFQLQAMKSLKFWNGTKWLRNEQNLQYPNGFQGDLF